MRHILWLAALAISACATSSQLLDATEARYVRTVAPFSVSEQGQRPYDEPFLGGFNVPRPQFVDIDADGDLDLFVQETSGKLMFFEKTGVGYRWRTDAFQDIDIGEWYRFADLDSDGDIDLLAEARYSYVRYYRNDGDARDARFVSAVDTVKLASGEPLFVDRQNIPNIVDIDCDGLLDLFVGRVTGTVMRYESIGLDSDGVPRFSLVTDRFEDIEIIGQMASLHGANTLAFGDIDDDGDQDFFWGDFFEAGLLFIRNQGTCSELSLRGEPQNFPLRAPIKTSGYNAPAVADLDGDGDLDVAVGVLGGAYNANTTSVDNFLMLEHTEGERFIHRTDRMIRTMDVGSESIPHLADLDGDGDFDLLLSNKIEPDQSQFGRVYRYENVGTAANPEFVGRGAIALAGSFHQAPATGDLDGDGDLDLLVGKWNRETAYLRNDGGTFVEVDPAFVSLTRGSNSTPALVDIDADGDLDLFIGEASGTLNFYRNVGSSSQATFELVSDLYGDIDVGRRSTPAFSDLDGDGDADLMIGSELDGIVWFENTGSIREAHFESRGAVAVAAPALSTPFPVDIDADGDQELFVGGISGGLLFFERRP